MRRFRSAAGLALAVVAALGLAGPMLAGEPVPFRGSLVGDVTHTPVDARTDFVLVEATGTATHLGLFTVAVPHFVDTPTRTAAGYYEFTAANGDTLTADYTESFTPTDVPGVFADVITATITGGTGRFAGATGSFVSHRAADHVTGIVSDSFEGTISTPH